MKKYVCPKCKKTLDEVILLYHGEDWLIWNKEEKDYERETNGEWDRQIICPECRSTIKDYERF